VPVVLLKRAPLPFGRVLKYPTCYCRGIGIRFAVLLLPVLKKRIGIVRCVVATRSVRLEGLVADRGIIGARGVGGEGSGSVGGVFGSPWCLRLRA